MRKLAWVFFCLVLVGASCPQYEIIILGSDEGSYQPTPTNSTPIADADSFDAVVAGAGLGGLSAAVYLTDHNKKVLVLEKEKHLGGLAAGGATGTVQWGRGASYWTRAYDEEKKILDHIGLADYQTRYPIHEPSDSFYYKGELFLGIWEEATLEELPASFALFKYALQKADEAGKIPNQPLEEAGDRSLDRLNTAQWIRSMPTEVAKTNDPVAEKLHDKLLADPRIDPQDPMAAVMDLMTLYCRSALGTTPEQISAIAFANFYISEIETRYTTPTGTGGAAEHMIEILRKRPEAKLVTEATVTGMKNLADGIEVAYVRAGQLRSVKAKYGVFALPLKFAPKVLEGLEAADPTRVKALKGLKYSHYNVHNVLVKGHPYRATYDTWNYAKDYSESDFTDLILGRWMDPDIKGYEGMRDFAHDPKDEVGVLSLYHPLPLGAVSQGYTEAQARAQALHSVQRMFDLYEPLLKTKWGTRIEVERVETTRWPFSIHVAEPGHFRKLGKLFRKPFGRVYFANNNVGTPTFEEALFRGHCAANNVLKDSDPSFQFEAWTRCPKE